MERKQAILFIGSPEAPPSVCDGQFEFWDDLEHLKLRYDKANGSWASDLGAGFMPVTVDTANTVLCTIWRMRRRRGQK